MPAETHMNRQPFSRDEIAAMIIARVAEVGNLDDEQVLDLDEASLLSENGIDPMAMISLAEWIEEDLGERTVGIELEDEELADIKTVCELTDYVCAQAGVET